MRPRLKLFTGDSDDAPPQVARNSRAIPAETTTISLGEMRRILADADGHNRTWLADFEDEPVRVSTDLHEVMTRYRQLRDSA